MLDRTDTLNRELLGAALAGLSRSPRTMSPKWFYDERGSRLFEDITRLPEYYPTRTETGILRQRAGELAVMFAGSPMLLELGSGSSVKTRLLLDAMDGLDVYAPLDISREHLGSVAEDLRRAYPDLAISSIVGDFNARIDLPPELTDLRKVIFFPGSTIGNLDRAEALELLTRLSGMPNVDGLVLGADLVKDTRTLVRAYDDDAGVTAAFNRNLLLRLNRECDADFDPDAFDHEARWNDDLERIEMHLVSRRRQVATVGKHRFSFTAGESLHTENSHKFRRVGLEEMAAQSRWTMSAFWTDADALFSVCVLRKG